jgi:UPF0716 family protein affecting phage T7 exclusion
MRALLPALIFLLSFINAHAQPAQTIRQKAIRASPVTNTTSQTLSKNKKQQDEEDDNKNKDGDEDDDDDDDDDDNDENEDDDESSDQPARDDGQNT